MNDVIIIGAGPAGLGAGWRLLEKGYKNFLILEKNNYPGGLSASFKTPEKFTFDLGGHVFFSKDRYFTNLAHSLLKNEIYFHQRNASILIKNKNIPYPFQDHISELPQKVQLKIAQEFLNLSQKKLTLTVKKNNHFLSWIKKTFGSTISNIFMIPYNQKVWAYDLKKMGAYWIRDRVSTLTIEDILERIILGKGGKKWGPNSEFFFPQYGTGYLFKKMAQHLENHILFNHSVKNIDTKAQILKLWNGKEFKYQALITSMSLKDLINQIKPNSPEYKSLKMASSALRYNSGFIVGLGINFNIETNKHWIYFPEKKYPWFRMTVLSNYSPFMAPSGKSSLMFDTSYNPYRGLQTTTDEIISLLGEINFLPPIESKHIISKFEQRIPLFYPIPTKFRDKHLSVLMNFLQTNHIYSIGRFGRWEYEEGNMDHAFIHGKKAADRLISGN